MMKMNFKMNALQQEVFNAIHAFNRNASFEYAEWLKNQQAITAPAIQKQEEPKAKASVLPVSQATIPDDCFAKKVKVRMTRNGRNVATEEFTFLIVDLEDRHLAQQIDEVSCSWNSVSQSWTTATVTRANGKAATIFYTVPQFLQRANAKRKRKHGFAQSQPFNFSKAVY